MFSKYDVLAMVGLAVFLVGLYAFAGLAPCLMAGGIGITYLSIRLETEQSRGNSNELD